MECYPRPSNNDNIDIHVIKKRRVTSTEQN